jgi:hypothetical protein
VSANPFIERVANTLANTAHECRQAPDPYRAMANRLEEQQLLNRPVETVWAGFPVKVRRAGLMVELDNEPLFKALLIELAMQVRENPDDVVAELVDIADLADSVGSRHTVDSREEPRAALDARLDLLINGDGDARGLGGAEQHLTSQDAWDLGHLLIERAGPRMPHRQQWDAA